MTHTDAIGPRPDGERGKSIDSAIDDCASTIRHHARQPIFEVLAALVLLTVSAYSLVTLARLQGADNDSKRQVIQATIESKSRDLLPMRATRTNAEATVRELNESAAFKGLRDRVRALSAQLTRTPAQENALSQLGVQLTSNEQRLALAEAQLKELNVRISDTQAEVDASRKELATFQGKPLVSDAMLFSNGAFVVLVVAVLAGVYRYHLREASRLQQHKLAFLRIRIAANNSATPGFDGEVRTALTKGAFDIPASDQPSGLLGRRLESPVPGHPTADLTTAIVNRILEETDVVLKPRDSAARADPKKSD